MSDQGTPVEITVDGSPVEARPGELLIEACERAGTYIPRFCHHNRLEPVGMCRMCLVEVDTGRGPALQPSCMVPCSSGMVVDTESERTRKAQDGVLEFLLVNHPLDCPVCDKGGECPLQDMTMAFGPGESRFVEEKRHFEKPIPVNDVVFLDRERCILCDRCTRFADEVAGDTLIHFQGRGAHTEVNTFPDEPFSSYFSGNTVQLCPVGALTAAPYRFKARPWDLEEVESTSVVDSVGSRIAVQSSRDRVLRFQGVDADAVNWGWLSDKERFAFEAYDHEDRLSGPLLRGDDGELAPAGWGAALDAVADSLDGVDPDRVAVLGGARLTNESQYAWAKLAKGVIGTDHVDAQLGDGLPAEVVLGLPRATIDEACAPGGMIVLLGPDPKEELGALYLRLRHAVVHDGATLVELTPRRTGLSAHAAHSLRVLPGGAAAAVDAMFGAGAPAGAAGLSTEELAGAALPLGWFAWRSDSRRYWTADYRSGVGEQRHWQLADGSRLLLGSAGAAQFDGTRRQLQLLDGEAQLDVADGPQALQVLTRDGLIRAGGGRLNLRCDPHGSRIALLEGEADSGARRRCYRFGRGAERSAAAHPLG